MPLSRDVQLAAFERVAHACAEGGGKVLSLHAVRSADAVMDVLERTGCTESYVCVLHWFSGASDELHRAVKQGCLFSVNPRMLATKRGRAYVRAIPADRLLLETDLPPESAARYDAADVETPLRATLAELAALRAEDPEALETRASRSPVNASCKRRPFPAWSTAPGEEQAGLWAVAQQAGWRQAAVGPSGGKDGPMAGCRRNLRWARPATRLSDDRHRNLRADRLAAGWRAWHGRPLW